MVKEVRSTVDGDSDNGEIEMQFICYEQVAAEWEEIKKSEPNDQSDIRVRTLISVKWPVEAVNGSSPESRLTVDHNKWVKKYPFLKDSPAGMPAAELNDRSIGR